MIKSMLQKAALWFKKLTCEGGTFFGLGGILGGSFGSVFWLMATSSCGTIRYVDGGDDCVDISNISKTINVMTKCFPI
jgi:hypothetical protein